MKPAIKVAFASGSPALNRKLIERMKALYPELPLYVVSEFPPDGEQWVAYHPVRGFCYNLAACRRAFSGKRVRLAGVLLVRTIPYRAMKVIALLLSPSGFIAFNENLDNYMLRRRSARPLLRHLAWRAGEFVKYQVHPGGGVHTSLWVLRRPARWHRPLARWRAWLAGFAVMLLKRIGARRATGVAPPADLPDGISVVIPSRNGRELLAGLLPGLIGQSPQEVIVVDNGSDDGTADFLASNYPDAIVEHCAAPLSFARAANRGLRRARFSHVLLLNNDMVVEPGFLIALRRAFERMPELFCATAEIRFPPGVRREETGKAVMPPRDQRDPKGFPIQCELPFEGEDASYVLYGSGGCSLYSAAKLRALGGLDEIYEPAYVEDLDIGFRAWQRGWPTVFCAGARVLHYHRTTTARYFTAEQLDEALETNYLRFLARAVASPRVFRELWRETLWRLNLRAANEDRAALAALRRGGRAPLWLRRPERAALADEHILALASGAVAVFPGRAASGRPVVLVASALCPVPLAHGGAVRIYNLMRRAARDFDQVLVHFAVDELTPPPPELLEICAEVVVVCRVTSHTRPRTHRPDTVEEFDAPAFHAALRQTVRKWRPAVAQLEFTQMAQYAADCAPARTILVEHDITFDLYQQLLAGNDDWERRGEHRRWLRFETAAWRQVDCVVAMSEKDRAQVRAARAECLPNGVDLERFQPAGAASEPRLLFIGSFRHLPNLLALEFFLNEVWPRLQALEPRLHVIAGARHDYYLGRYGGQLELNQPDIEVEGLVDDVRPAYRRAAVVIAPLVASAGTNIKIMEAMAMGKAIVSTPAGINGLELEDGRDLLVARTGEDFALAVAELLRDTGRRLALEVQARATAERLYDWGAIAARQRELYRELMSV